VVEMGKSFSDIYIFISLSIFMLKIRLARAGKKNSPFFRVVLTEHTAPSKSGFKEVLGFYNPISKEFKINNVDAVKKYLSHGTQLSPRVEKLIKLNNISL